MASRRRQRPRRRRYDILPQDPVRIDREIALRTHTALDAVIFDLLEGALDLATRIRRLTPPAGLIRARHLQVIGQDLIAVAVVYKLVARRSASPDRARQTRGSG